MLRRRPGPLRAARGGQGTTSVVWRFGSSDQSPPATLAIQPAVMPASIPAPAIATPATAPTTTSDPPTAMMASAPKLPIADDDTPERIRLPMEAKVARPPIENMAEICCTVLKPKKWPPASRYTPRARAVPRVPPATPANAYLLADATHDPILRTAATKPLEGFCGGLLAGLAPGPPGPGPFGPAPAGRPPGPGPALPSSPPSSPPPPHSVRDTR